MKQNKIYALLLIFAMMCSFVMPISATSTPQIIITTNSQTSIAKIGDIIKVTVSMSDFAELSIANPSLHFNPNVVKVLDKDKNIQNILQGDSTFMENGEALGTGENSWQGTITENQKYPYFNNDTGVVGVTFDSYPPRDLSGTQKVYSLYVQTVAPGDPEIRLSRYTDGVGKSNPLEYYDDNIYPRSEYGNYTSQYTIPSIGFNETIDAPVVTDSRATVYTRIMVKNTDGNFEKKSTARIGDVLRLDIHASNMPEIANICLPLKYEEQSMQLLDKSCNPVISGTDVHNVLDVPDKFQLFANVSNDGGSGYPKYDTENGFLRLLIMSPNDNDTIKTTDGDLICSVYFKALTTGEFEYFFSSKNDENIPYDPSSPKGLMYHDQILLGMDAPPDIVPTIIYDKLSIDQEKSKKPDVVAVIPNPNSDTATVIVTGAVPGASVAIYGESGNQIGVFAIANEEGYAVFAEVPLNETTENRIYSDAKEPNKLVSDKEWGEPDNPPVEQILISLDPLDLIVVNYGTPIEQVTFSETVDALIGYKMMGYDSVFIPDGFIQLPLPSGTWKGTYNGNESNLYNLTNTPTYPTVITSDKQAKQPIFVKPDGMTDNQHIIVFVSDESLYGVPQKVNTNEKATRPQDPTKDRYIFDDWYIKDTQGKLNKYNFETPVTTDIVLQAVFKQDTTDKKYNVAGTLSGGSVSGLEVTYTLDSSATKTIKSDTNGNYEIKDIQSGTRVVITPPSQSGYSVSPTSITIDEISKDWESQNFYYTKTSPNSGGGGGGSSTQTSPLYIKCIHKETGKILYTQTVEKVEVGTIQTVNAPDLKGYLLVDETPRQITIKNSKTDNIVEFMYEEILVPNLLNKTDHYRYLYGYEEDGTIRPDCNISREEVATIFFRLLTSESRKTYRNTHVSFTDVVADTWSIEAIGTMENIKIMQGYLDGTYKPTNPITRAEFAAVAMRFDTLEEDAKHNFSDIEYHWAEEYIASAYQLGWIDGYEDETFRPNQPITRTEAAKLINRVLERQVDKEGVMDELIEPWPDLKIDHWGYYEIIEASVSHKYDRREEGTVVEDWTGKGLDIDFAKE